MPFTCFGDLTIVAPHFTKLLIYKGFLKMKNGFIAFFMALFCFAPSAFSFCFDDAGRYYNINPDLLEAIAYTESRLEQGAINDKNRNGSVDYGLMQINSSWLSKLKNFGITKEDVINDSCINVFVGAWVLAQNFKSHGENWTSVGAYNAGFSSKKEKTRMKYIAIVKSNFQSIRERK